MRTLGAAAVAMMALVVCAASAYACPTATISGSFADGCRDFAAHASKDISHVELHYADGRVIKKERINRRSFSIDGDVGSEIDVAIVKAGVTRKTFACDAGGSAPVAVLEVRMSPGCRVHTPTNGDAPFYWCLSETTNAARTVFVDPGDLKIDLGCLPTEPTCFAVTFRATNSTDPDGDIASWSIAFDDGGTAQGGWAAAPPDEVTHEYAGPTACATTYCHITLTVTDSRGRTATDSIDLAFFDTTPD